MNVTDLRRELNDEPLPEPLDPDILVVLSDVRERGARRKRRLLGGVAVLVAVSLGLTTAIRAGWLGVSSGSYVAGAPSATAGTQSTWIPVSTQSPGSSVSVVTRGPSGEPVTVTPVGPIPDTGVIPAVPYAAVGRSPAVRTIPDNTWVEVVSGVWVATTQTNIVVTSFGKPTISPKAACAAGTGDFGCRGTVHNTNRTPAFGGYQGLSEGGVMVDSVSFEGAPASTKAQLTDGSTYWGVCWRLAGIPGWTFTTWTVPLVPLTGSVSIGPSGSVSLNPTSLLDGPILTIYDASGSEIGRWESAR
jgi:hypothetical protein